MPSPFGDPFQGLTPQRANNVAGVSTSTGIGPSAAPLPSGGSAGYNPFTDVLNHVSAFNAALSPPSYQGTNTANPFMMRDTPFPGIPQGAPPGVYRDTPFPYNPQPPSGVYRDTPFPGIPQYQRTPVPDFPYNPQIFAPTRPIPEPIGDAGLPGYGQGPQIYQRTPVPDFPYNPQPPPGVYRGTPDPVVQPWRPPPPHVDPVLGQNGLPPGVSLPHTPDFPYNPQPPGWYPMPPQPMPPVVPRDTPFPGNDARNAAIAAYRQPGQVRYFPNGRIGRWDGYGWEHVGG